MRSLRGAFGERKWKENIVVLKRNLDCVEAVWYNMIQSFKLKP